MHFIEIAYGSLMGSYCQIQLAQDLGYLTEEDILSIKEQFADCSKLISVKQLVAGGGVALIGITLIPLLSGLLG